MAISKKDNSGLGPSDESKMRILRAATRVFAEKGLDGARVDEIAEEASINKRMLYHYYGNKEDLYAAVLRESLTKICDTGFNAYDPQDDPRDNIRKIINSYFYFLAENEELVRLLNWEALNRGAYIDPLLAEFKNSYEDTLNELLSAGMNQGLLKPDLEVEQVLLSIDALCLIYFSHNQTFKRLWKDETDSQEMHNKRINHVIDLVFNGILTGK